ncbi:MAG: DUF4091 domain-containing protein [Thermoguttaceae bacterium]|jgi:hypothetical protein
MSFRAPLPAVLALTTSVLLWPCLTVCAGQQFWALDPLIKVLDGDRPDGSAEKIVRISAARGEAEAGQVAFRSDKPVSLLKVSAGSLRHVQGAQALTDVRVALLNYHLLRSATHPVVAKELCAKPPILLPDAFSLQSTMALAANLTRSAWISVRVPADAASGLYRGQVTLEADGATSRLPVEVTVSKAVVPQRRGLKLFTWLFYDAAPGWGQLPHKLGGQPWDERDWATLQAIARNMVEHRQNVFTVPVIHNVLSGPDVFAVRTLKQGDSYRFDFSIFDRCVETFLKEDPEATIVGGYLALFGATGRPLDGRGNFAMRSPQVLVFDFSTGQKVSTLESVDVDTASYQGFLKALLPALQEHLETKGWTRQFYISLNDETFPQLVRSRLGLAEEMHKLAPKLRVLDANRNTDQAGSIDVWFPLPNQFEAHREFYAARQRAGDEVGFYTCVTPGGYNMNRFVSYPLLKTRLLHWYNFKFGLTGFLHWGYNAQLPPADAPEVIMDGDANLVYKDAAGYPVPSIRQEAMRDGIEDYELLKVAEGKDAALARRLCDHLVTDCRRCTRSIAEFRYARELLLELAGCEQPSAELRRRIEALPTEHEWLLKPLAPTAPSTDGWRLVFSDDFERGELGPDWVVEKHTQWAIRKGRLTLVKGDGAVLFARPLRHAQRIEFDGWAETDHPCDLSGILCADPAKRAAYESGYSFNFGTEMNAFSKLLINFVEYLVLPNKITPGKRHHVICQRDGDRLGLWVDGQCVFHCLHRDRLDGPQETRAGLYTYGGNQLFDNVRIYEK